MKTVKVAILSQMFKGNGKALQQYPELENHPFVHIAYVDYIKASGADYHLVDCRITLEEARKIYNSTNGLILPGGSSNLKTSEYAKIAKHFRQWAIDDFNDGKRFYPIVGICLGFQFLLRESIDDSENCLTTTGRDTKYINLPIQMQVDSDQNNNEEGLGLFANMSSDVKELFENEDVTYNNHIWSLLCSDIDKYEGLSNVRMIATSIETKTGVKFVAAHTDKRYPFHGFQWHPEKHEFDLGDVKVSHTESAQRCSRHLLQQFYQQCCKDRDIKNNAIEEDLKPVEVREFCPEGIEYIKDSYILI